MTSVVQDGPGVEIDPRIEERRSEIRRSRARRRFLWVLAVLALIGVAGLCWWATISPLLDVDRVRVVGATRTATDDVVAATRIAPGDRMIAIDVAAATGAVERLPWVARARVGRSWPGTVRVLVEEREPLAQVASGSGGWLLADAEGRLLAESGARLPSLPVIDGVVPAGEPGMHLDAPSSTALVVAQALDGFVASETEAIRLAPAAQVELVLRAGGVARLGSTADLAAKLDAVGAVLDQVDRTCLGVIDVEVAAAPVVTRDPECEAALLADEVDEQRDGDPPTS